jgi:hypothetical protein
LKLLSRLYCMTELCLSRSNSYKLVFSPLFLLALLFLILCSMYNHLYHPQPPSNNHNTTPPPPPPPLLPAQIRLEKVEENLQSAMENLPESFGRVTMLYVNLHINGTAVSDKLKSCSCLWIVCLWTCSTFFGYVSHHRILFITLVDSSSTLLLVFYGFSFYIFFLLFLRIVWNRSCLFLILVTYTYR